MLSMVTVIAMGMVGIGISFNVWRLIIGPSIPDRILALDTLYINAIALLVLQGIYRRTDDYFEVALLIAALGFIGTLAFAKYLLRGNIIE